MYERKHRLNEDSVAWSRPLRATVGTIAALLILMSLLPSGARSAIRFPEATILSSSVSANEPRVAVDTDESVMIAWQAWDGRNWRVQARRIDENGVPGPLLELTPEGRDAQSPAVDLDGNGQATIAWRETWTDNEEIRAVQISRTGELGETQTVSTAAGNGALEPDVAVNSEGTASISWYQWNGDVRVRSVAADGTLGPNLLVSGSGSSGHSPQVEVTASGDAFVVWTTNGAEARIHLGHVSPEGDVSPAVPVSPASGFSADPVIAATSEDGAIVAWRRGEELAWDVEMAIVGPDGAVGPIQTAGQGSQAPPVVARGPADAIYLAWSNYEGDGTWGSDRHKVQVRKMSPTGPLGDVRTLTSLDRDAYPFGVAVDSKGRVLVGWHEFNLPTGPPSERLQVGRLSGDLDSGVDDRTVFEGQTAVQGQIVVDELDRPTVAGTWACSGCAGPQIGVARGILTPETSILTAPAAITNDREPVFEFGSSEDGAEYECSLDFAEWVPCPSSYRSPALGDGEHLIAVRARDADQEVDPTPAEHAFEVDTQLPAVFIESGPAGITNDATPTFGFWSEEETMLECSLDSGNAAFGACSGPSSHTPSEPVGDGGYTFRVRATDAAGNRMTQTRSFTVDTVAPNTTIGSGPSGPTNNASPSFGFSASESNSSFECRLDSGAFAPCVSPKTYANLRDGQHTVQVRAKDQLGTADPSPASRSITVDTAVKGDASAKKTQTQKGSKVVVTIVLSAGEALRAEVGGRIKVNRNYYKLKSKSLDSGEFGDSLKLKPKKKNANNKILKALDKGKQAKAKVRIELIDQLGNTSIEMLAVELKR